MIGPTSSRKVAAGEDGDLRYLAVEPVTGEAFRNPTAPFVTLTTMSDGVTSESIHDGLTPIGLTIFQECLRQLAEGLKPLPDKPEETTLGTLAALWYTAAGRPISVQGAVANLLPELDEAGIAKLRALMRDRMAGIPLAHPPPVNSSWV